MKIPRADINKRTRPVLVRLSPEMLAWLEKVTEKAGGGIATTIRSIVEEAHRGGVSVVSAVDDEPRRRRRA